MPVRQHKCESEQHGADSFFVLLWANLCGQVFFSNQENAPEAAAICNRATSKQHPPSLLCAAEVTLPRLSICSFGGPTANCGSQVCHSHVMRQSRRAA